MTEKITLIIPLRLTANTHEGEGRLKRICATVPRDLFDILISDYGTQDVHSGPIRAAIASGIDVVNHPSPGKLFSIGHARDFGVQMARGKIILFNDVDFLGTPEMYRQIHAEAVRRDLAVNLFDFFCIPVVFLTEAGTKAWFAHTQETRPFLDSTDIAGLETAQSDIQFTAFGSSAIVVNRHHYLSLGGHDPKFSGHGAEDYDLLNRLAALAPKGPRPKDYFTDFKDNGVRNYWGFRPFFALYGLDLFARGIHLVHLWHPRRMEKGYFRPQPNFRHLRRVMLRFERRGTMPLPLGDLTRKGRWLVFYRTAKDLSLLRQLLPFARQYRLAQIRSLPAAFGLARLMDMAATDMILIAPDVGGDVHDFAADPSLTRIPVLQIQPGVTQDAYTFLHIRSGFQDVSSPAVAQGVRAANGRVHHYSWRGLVLDGLMVLDSGTIPPPEPTNASIFASFGGETMLDRTLHPRPVRKKKSSLWVRLKRHISRA